MPLFVNFYFHCLATFCTSSKLFGDQVYCFCFGSPRGYPDKPRKSATNPTRPVFHRYCIMNLVACSLLTYFVYTHCMNSWSTSMGSRVSSHSIDSKVSSHSIDSKARSHSIDSKVRSHTMGTGTVDWGAVLVTAEAFVEAAGWAATGAATAGLRFCKAPF